MAHFFWGYVSFMTIGNNLEISKNRQLELRKKVLRAFARQSGIS